MTGTGKNVVPFERPAAYWAAKARRHYTPAKMPDAAKLLRKALETGNTLQNATELARVYYDMGCYTAAERLLLKVLGMGGLTGPGCCLTAQCALEQEEEGLAQRALEISLRVDPWGESSELAEDILEFHPWHEGERIPRGERSACLCDRARRCLARGQTEKARQIALRAWKKGRSCDAALLCGALQEKPEKQIPFFAYAAEKAKNPFRPRLLLAHAYCAKKDIPKALHALLAALPLCETLGQAEFFCSAAWEAGQPGLALTLLSEKLSAQPFSVDYLRLQYLTFKRMGREKEAFDTLQKMIEIDPEDASLKRYRHDESDIRMDESRLVYLSVLASPLLMTPHRLRPGPLNRTLHLLCLALQEEMSMEEIYFFLPPMWRKLTRTQKEQADDQDIGMLLPLAVYLLRLSGKNAEAKRLFASCPGKKRMNRILRRFARMMDKE